LKLGKNELWFYQGRDDIGPDPVKSVQNQNVAKFKKAEGKFYLINISPFGKELDHIGNDPQKLKAFVRAVKNMQGISIRGYLSRI
jgi:hypothetical protein